MKQTSLKRIRDLVKLARVENLTRLVVGDVTIEPGVAATRPEKVFDPDISVRRQEIARTLGVDPSLVLSDEDLLPRASE